MSYGFRLCTGFGGNTFTFAGPGMQRTYYRTGASEAGGRARGGQPPAQNPNLLWQLFPILIIALFSLISYLPSVFGPQEPSFSFAPSGRFREQRFTAPRSVSYYVDKREWDSNEMVNKARTKGAGEFSRSGLRSFENKVCFRKLDQKACEPGWLTWLCCSQLFH